MRIQNLHRRIGERTGRGDFYCHKAGLVIELDGDVHDLQQEEDARQEKVLSEMELKIVRFRNEEVVMDFSALVSKLRGLVA
jgi:very-short-patch-repair endonuclease